MDVCIHLFMICLGSFIGEFLRFCRDSSVVEQKTENLWVAGSNPALGKDFKA